MFYSLSTRQPSPSSVILICCFPFCLLSSTAVFNLIDYPGVAFPTGLKADPKLDVKLPRAEGEYMSDIDKFVDEICPSPLFSLPFERFLTPTFLFHRRCGAVQRSSDISPDGCFPL
jgi:hypothetical protein